MIYNEFIEAVGALAQYADPNPYVPLHIRLDSFLRLTLIPNLLKSDVVVKGLVNPEEVKGTGAEAAAAEAAAKAVANRSAGFEKEQGGRERRAARSSRANSLKAETGGSLFRAAGEALPGSPARVSSSGL